MATNEPLYQDGDLCFHYSEQGVRELEPGRSGQKRASLHVDDPVQKLSAVRRLLQVPRIEGCYAVDNRKQRARFEALSRSIEAVHHYLLPEEFRKRFYSD